MRILRSLSILPLVMVLCLPPAHGAPPAEAKPAPSAKIAGIEFTGAKFVNAARLRTQIESSTPTFGFIGGTYREKTAQDDLLRLEDYYKKHGFRDVKVSMEIQMEKDQKHVKLVFHIEEGQRYKNPDAAK